MRIVLVNKVKEITVFHVVNETKNFLVQTGEIRLTILNENNVSYSALSNHIQENLVL
jgi:hypothetical protein